VIPGPPKATESMVCGGMSRPYTARLASSCEPARVQNLMCLIPHVTSCSAHSISHGHEKSAGPGHRFDPACAANASNSDKRVTSQSAAQTCVSESGRNCTTNTRPWCACALAARAPEFQLYTLSLSLQHLRACACVCVCIYVCVCACACVCVCVCVFLWVNVCMNICMHMHTHFYVCAREWPQLFPRERVSLVHRRATDLQRSSRPIAASRRPLALNERPHTPFS
jgi:hypothetical protein